MVRTADPTYFCPSSIASCLLPVALFFCTAAAPPDAWPMFRGDRELSGNAESKLPDKPEVLWKFEAGDAIASTAAISDGIVYFGSDDEHLYALDFVTGALRWKFKAEAFVRSSPTVTDEFVIFGDDEGVVRALDRRTGELRWSFTTEGEVISSANVIGHRVIFGSYDGLVYAVNRTNGNLVWKAQTEGRVHATPAISERFAESAFVIVSGCDEFLHVLDADDGSQVRKVPMGSVVGASPLVVGDRVYLGTYGNSVVGLNWRKGESLWTYADPDRQFPFMSSAAAFEGLVILGGRDKRVRALDATSGKSVWEFATKGRVDGSPVIVENRVFVGSQDGVLYALDARTGKETWRFEAGSPISASPAVAAGQLIIGTEDGLVYAFGTKPAERP